MVFILGVLALIQIVFLPGAILIKFFKIGRGFIQTVVYTFGLSLIFNFLWVFGLTFFKINYPIAHYFLFAIETAIYFWLSKEMLFASIEFLAMDWMNSIKKLPDYLSFIFQKDDGEAFYSRIIRSLVYFLFFIWAISGLLWIGNLFLNNLGTAFNLWDAVVSWNKWAVDFFNNLISSHSGYPQLIPANFSITYSFLRNSEIQVFAKGIMPLFTLFTWLLILDLAFIYKMPGMFIALVVTRYLTKKILGNYLGDGYVDVALLFFSFLTVYTLLRAREAADDSTKTQYLYLGAIFAAGAALTKQNGLLVFTLFPLLAILILTDSMQHKDNRDRLTIILKPFITGLIVLLPWYAFDGARIILGLNRVTVMTLMSAELHADRTYIDRFVRAFEMLGIYTYLFPFVLITLPLIPKIFRQIALIMIFPYTIIWAFLFSITSRNLAMVIPFLGLVAGLGAQGLLDTILGLLEKVKLHRIKTVVYLLLLIALILGIGVVITDQEIYAAQVEDQKNALLPRVNQKLYAFFEQVGVYEPIMTQYPISVLPYLEDLQIHEPFAIYEEFYANFAAHPEVKYFLVWDARASKQVLEIIDQFQNAGAIVYIFEQNKMKFYQVIDRDYILANSPR